MVFVEKRAPSFHWCQEDLRLIYEQGVDYVVPDRVAVPTSKQHPPSVAAEAGEGAMLAEPPGSRGLT